MKFIFANWKMYLDRTESVALTKEFCESYTPQAEVKVALFPTALACTEAESLCRGTSIGIGAQNVAWTPKGAYTGAISAHLFKEVGASYALCGHSERRHIFGETDSDVRKKIEACLDAGLTPVVCIGETKEEKENGKREYRLKKQLMSAFENLSFDGKEILVAYEPVWAIGTGDACVPADADDVHGWIREELKHYTSTTIPIVYGGSVNEQNVASYLAQETVDGVLIGSASTRLESLLALATVAEKL